MLVNKARDGMRNLLIEDLDERAEIIVGQKKPLSMMEGFHGSWRAFTAPTGSFSSDTVPAPASRAP